MSGSPSRRRRWAPGARAGRRPDSVGIGGVGGGQDLELAAVFGQRAESLDGPGEGELGAAEPLDEVAAAGGPEQLEVGELRIQGREAARHPLGEDRLAGDDAVALEHQLGLRAELRTGSGSVLEQRRGQRPAALDRGAAGRAAASEAATLPFLRRDRS
jgi:hypothetical protein